MTRRTVHVVLDNLTALNTQWYIEARVQFDGQSAHVELLEVIGRLYESTSVSWFDDARFRRRLNRIENESVDQQVIYAALAQLDAKRQLRAIR